MGATHRIQRIPGSLRMLKVEESQDGQCIPATDLGALVTCSKSFS